MTTITTDDPVTRASALGHTVKYDPPHTLSGVHRWTCTQCGAAVLSNHGNAYGSAIEDRCAAVVA